MEEQLQAFQGSPQPQSCRVIDFEHAEVRIFLSLPPRYLLVVSGIKPCLNMKVDLVPLVYVQQPEYWGIEVVGCLPGGLCLPAISSYSVELWDPPLGTQGIEVIGATQSERIEIPSKDYSQDSFQGSFQLSITSKVTGKIIARASLACSSDGSGSHSDPARACEQLRAADGRIEAIPPEEGPCTREFNPVILRASGTWNGEDRRFVGEFPNRCVGVRATGGVIFDF